MKRNEDRQETKRDKERGREMKRDKKRRRETNSREKNIAKTVSIRERARMRERERNCHSVIADMLIWKYGTARKQASTAFLFL